MKRESLIDRVETWVQAAAVVASYARGSGNVPFMTPSEMSPSLQIRWFMSHNRVKVQIEHNREVSRDYWLGGFSIGGIDPYLLVFRQNEALTEDDYEVAEQVIKTTFPYIKFIRCHFCEGWVVNDRQEGEWFCASCAELIPAKQSSTFGYVYVFGSKDEGRYKIGQSVKPNARLKDYELSKLPFPVEMIHIIPVDNKRKAEAELHRLFRDKRENGEWFRLSPDELARIIGLVGYKDGHWVS